jgi:hypothetical protein
VTLLTSLPLIFPEIFPITVGQIGGFGPTLQQFALPLLSVVQNSYTIGWLEVTVQATLGSTESIGEVSVERVMFENHPVKIHAAFKRHPELKAKRSQILHTDNYINY